MDILKDLSVARMTQVFNELNPDQPVEKFKNRAEATDALAGTLRQLNKTIDAEGNLIDGNPDESAPSAPSAPKEKKERKPRAPSAGRVHDGMFLKPADNFEEIVKRPKYRNVVAAFGEGSLVRDALPKLGEGLNLKSPMFATDRVAYMRPYISKVLTLGGLVRVPENDDASAAPAPATAPEAAPAEGESAPAEA